MGKTFTVNNRFDFTVSGIIKNVPPNSHFTFNILAPFPVLKKFGKDIESWGSYGYRTYVRLRKGTDYKPVSLKMKHYLKHSPDPDGKITLRLQPLKDIHLHSASIRSRGGSGDIRLVYIFTMIATFILIIACINFMNLTTARASNRAREVGMRKVTGARRIEIIKQFFGESILLSFIGLILAIFLVDLLLPVFNDLCGKQLHMDIFTNGGILVWLIGIALCTGILSGRLSGPISIVLPADKRLERWCGPRNKEIMVAKGSGGHPVHSLHTPDYSYDCGIPSDELYEKQRAWL